MQVRRQGRAEQEQQVSEARPRDNGGQKRDGLAFPRGRVLCCEQNNGLTNNNHLLVSSSRVLLSRPRISAQLSPCGSFKLNTRPDSSTYSERDWVSLS